MSASEKKEPAFRFKVGGGEPHVHIEEGIASRIDEICKVRNIEKSTFINQLLQSALDRFEERGEEVKKPSYADIFEMFDKGSTVLDVARSFNMDPEEVMQAYSKYKRYRDAGEEIALTTEFTKLRGFMILMEKLGESIREACDYYNRDQGICVARYLAGDLTAIRREVPNLSIPRRHGNVVKNRVNVKEYPHMCAICGHGE